MKNINFVAEAIYSDGTKKIRLFATENALSNWANKQYRKDNDVTIEVYNTEDVLIMTYHA